MSLFGAAGGTAALVLLAVGAGLATGTGARASSAGEPGSAAQSSRTWVERLGSDTTAVERARLDERSLRGTMVFRSPVTRILEYRALLDASGWPRSVEGTLRTPSTHPDGPPPQRFRVSVEDGEARVVTVTGSDTTSRSVPVTGRVLPAPPRLPVPVAFLELGTRQLRAPGADSLALSIVSPLAPAPIPFLFRADGPHRISARMAVVPMTIEVDDEGRVTAVDARGSTMNTLTRAEPVPDPGALAAEFGRRDARDGGFGTASPGDTVRVRLAGAEVEVRYSRPARRGREIWGGLVPFGEVWRTGANAATHLEADAALVLGGVELEAGAYTLWSLHEPDGGVLVVNAQTGQWGTQYDPDRDVARIPLEMERVEDSAERFTIELRADPDRAERGRLILRWADRRYSVDVRTNGK